MDGQGQRTSDPVSELSESPAGRPRASIPVVMTAAAAAGVLAVITLLGVTLAAPDPAERALPASAISPAVRAGADEAAQWAPLAVPHQAVSPAQQPVVGAVVPAGAPAPAAPTLPAAAPAGGVATPPGSDPITAPLLTNPPTAAANVPPPSTGPEFLPPATREPARPSRPTRPVPSPTAAQGATTIATVAAARRATSAEQVGIVDVTTVLDFGAGKAAGTGIVLPTGEILTNNHVIRDSTQITVTVVATGVSSAATVVGTDRSDDIAVLRLSGGSAGPAAALATGGTTVAVGDAVVPVGNALGKGGTATAAPGTVVALDQAIIASDDATGANAERLTGLIEFAAAIEPGDSGGPLYDGGVVVGVDTAAWVGVQSGLATAGYAIPIATATSIAGRIIGGEQSAKILQGLPAFLGVEVAAGPAATGGVRIVGVVPSSAAAAAGLHAGDTITAVDGTGIAGPAALSTLLAGHRPQDQVTITGTDSAGAAYTATVALAAGPAD